MDGVKVATASDTPTNGHVDQRALTRLREDMDRLRGRLFELFEAFGLDEPQAEAAKRVVRRTTYDMQLALERDLRGGK